MRQKHALAVTTALLLLVSLSYSGTCVEPLIDEHADLTFVIPSKDFYRVLAGGDRIQINVTADGDPITFAIYNNASEKLYNKDYVNSVFEQWTAPYNDTFDFYIVCNQLASSVTLRVDIVGTGPVSGGFDPMIIAIIAIVVVAVLLLATFFILRTKRKVVATPPPPPPPPPPNNGPFNS